jgi:hypothetical protein
VRRPVTIEPVVLGRVRLLAPAGVGVFTALHRQLLLVLAAWRTGIGWLGRHFVWRHLAIISRTVAELRRCQAGGRAAGRRREEPDG